MHGHTNIKPKSISTRESQIQTLTSYLRC